MPNVLAAGLNNPNPTLHCLGVLLSASRIEYSHGEFYYYEEGMTPHVCQAIEAIDAGADRDRPARSASTC